MKVYHIAMLMMAVLAALFMLTPIFRRKEQEKTKNERKYYDLLKNKDANTSELVSLARGVYGDHSNEILEDKISHDRRAMGV